MARYQIREDEAAVSVEVTDVDGKEDQLLEAFGECQAGNCSCPTDEYDKLAAMDVQQSSGVIKLRLEPKPGETLDTSEIAACLDYTTERISR